MKEGIIISPSNSAIVATATLALDSHGLDTLFFLGK